MYTLDIDLYTPEMAANPWPTLARIREEGPIVWNERGYWMSARDEVCRRIFTNLRHFTSRPIVPDFFGEEAFIAVDDPGYHHALRSAWTAAFRRDPIQSLGGMIRGMIDQMLDPLVERLEAGEAVDLVDGLCRHLPGYVIARLLGVPPDMQDSIVRWSDEMAAATAGGYDTYETSEAWRTGERAKQAMADYLVDQIRYRRSHPGEDLISQIVHSEIGATLSEEAMLINTRQLLFGGTETTANWLAHITHILATRPTLRAELSADRSLIPAAVEEMLRWEPVVHALPRSVYGGDAVIEDVTVPDGAPVVVLLGAANRDPRRHERPDELDIRRQGWPSLAFGFGMHNCIGMFLARTEAAQATNAILDRIPDYQLAGDINYGGFIVRGPSAVPIALQ
jgi:cytochrome P450